MVKITIFDGIFKIEQKFGRFFVQMVFRPDLADLENQYFSSFFGIFEQRGQFLAKYETKMIVIESCGSISPSFSSPEPNFATSTSKRSTICQNDYNPPKEPVYDIILKSDQWYQC